MSKAQVGDLIRVIAEGQTFIKPGEIYEVLSTHDEGVRASIGNRSLQISHAEYEIHRKAGEEDSPESAAVISGVGPDAPIVENELGAKQSKSPYRMDLIDAKALLEIAKVHSQGAEKYGDTNWRNISIEDNLNHALVHVYAYLAGDKQDDHLSHAATRMIFALALDLSNGQK